MSAATDKHHTKSGLIPEWLVIGPFEGGEPDALLEVPFIYDESGLAPDDGELYQAHQWSAKKVDAQGKIDFMQIGITRENVCMYAHVYVNSETVCNACLCIKSTDAYAVWMNGCRIITSDSRQAGTAEPDRARIRLGRGWNRILLKVIHHVGGFAFTGRITDM